MSLMEKAEMFENLEKLGELLESFESQKLVLLKKQIKMEQACQESAIKSQVAELALGSLSDQLQNKNWQLVQSFDKSDLELECLAVEEALYNNYQE